MTVSITDRLVIHQGDGIATNFPYDFWVQKETDIQVYLEEIATGDYTAIPSVDYIVNGVSLDEEQAGSIDYSPVGGPVEEEFNVIIVRTLPYTQETNIRNQGGYHPRTVEFQLDRIVQQIQQLGESVNRAVLGPYGSELGWRIDDIDADHFWKRDEDGDRRMVDGGSAQDIVNASLYASQVADYIAGLQFQGYGLRAEVTGLVAGVPGSINVIHLAGTTVEGDSGEGYYKRALVDPGSGTRFQDAAGAWWVRYFTNFASGISISANRAAIKALDTSTVLVTYLKASDEGDLFHWDSSDLSATLVVQTLNTSAIDATANTYSFAADHDLRTGHVVIQTVTQNNVTANTFYYVIKVDDDTISLATSWANAIAGTAVDITATTASTLKQILDPEEGIYIIPTGKNITGTEGAYVRGTTRRVNPYMFQAVGDAVTDDRRWVFAADAYCVATGSTLEINPDEHAASDLLVLYSVDYYLPWGNISLTTTDDWKRVIEICAEATIITLADGTYESPTFTSGDFTYHEYIVRYGKGMRINAENDLLAVWRTPIQLKNCSEVFFNGILFDLVNDQQMISVGDGVLYLDDCSSNSPAGTRPNKIGGFIISHLSNVIIRALTRNCTYNFTNCSGTITSPPYAIDDPQLGQKVGDYLQINYSSTFWCAPSSSFWIRFLSGNSNGGGFITSITQGFMYLHNTLVEGTAKNDGSICVGVQRGAQLRLVQDTATNMDLGLRNAEIGVSLSGGSRVACEGGANSGNDMFVFTGLEYGMMRTGGGIGDISYETAQVDFTGTDNPTSVAGTWTPI